MKRFRRSFGPLAPAVLLVACAPPLATAGVLTLEPELSLGAEFSTNPQLRLDTAASGEAAIAKVGAPMAWDGDTQHWQLAPRARLGVAGGDSSLGTNAYYLAGAGDVRWELSKLAVTAQVADDSSVVRQPDAGTLTRSAVRQHTVDGTFDWTRTLTERTFVDLEGSLQRVSYGKRPDVGLYDFHDEGITGQLSRRLTARVTLQVLAARSVYELPTTSLQTVSTMQQAGLVGQVSELWSCKALIGRTRVSARGTDRSPTGAAYVASLTRDGQRVGMVLSVVRSLQPSGFGVMVAAREASARLSWALSERKALYMTGRRVVTSDVFGSLTFADRSYEALAAGLTWQVSPYWDLRAEANYARVAIAADIFDAAASGFGTGGSISVVRRFGRKLLK